MAKSSGMNLGMAKSSTSRLQLAEPSSKVVDPNAPKVKFDHDFACGVFVGAFDIPTYTVTLEVVEILEPVAGRTERVSPWLQVNDMLAILTREYGKAQQKLSSLMPPVPGRPTGTPNKDWEEANRRLIEMRDQVVCLLHSRRAYHRAKDMGVKILIEA